MRSKRRLEKPRFGILRYRGVCPPSKPLYGKFLPDRALAPLFPRPLVPPRPEPIPRPTRRFFFLAPGFGRMSVSARGPASVLKVLSSRQGATQPARVATGCGVHCIDEKGGAAAGRGALTAGNLRRTCPMRRSRSAIVRTRVELKPA